MKFPYPKVVPNLYEFLSSVKHKIRCEDLKNAGNQLQVAIDYHSMEKVTF